MFVAKHGGIEASYRSSIRFGSLRISDRTLNSVLHSFSFNSHLHLNSNLVKCVVPEALCFDKGQQGDKGDGGGEKGGEGGRTLKTTRK